MPVLVKLYTFSMYSLLCINYTSVKLVLKKKDMYMRSWVNKDIQSIEASVEEAIKVKT
jgi:hypothetical protein